MSQFVLYFLIISSIVFAQSENKELSVPILKRDIIAKRATITTLSAANLVEEAEAMLLKQDRLGALELLRAHKKNFSQNSKQGKELRDKIEAIQNAFVSEKAQQMFQKSESMYFSGVAPSSDEYKEALKLEPEHPAILFGLARTELKEKRCSQAQESLNRLEAVTQNRNDEFLYLQIQIDLCLGNVTLAQSNLSSIAAKIGWQLQALQSLIFVNTQDWINALDWAQKTTSSISTFPEAYYWKLLAKKSLGQNVDAEKTNYLEKCKSIDFSLRKSFSAFPDTCKNISRLDK